ncbi:MAG: hypothetical protein ACYS1C_09195 [Planctomycetota bacterium]|jgi:hypothetical protein
MEEGGEEALLVAAAGALPEEHLRLLRLLNRFTEERLAAAERARARLLCCLEGADRGRPACAP